MPGLQIPAQLQLELRVLLVIQRLQIQIPLGDKTLRARRFGTHIVRSNRTCRKGIFLGNGLAGSLRDQLSNEIALEQLKNCLGATTARLGEFRIGANKATRTGTPSDPTRPQDLEHLGAFLFLTVLLVLSR